MPPMRVNRTVWWGWTQRALRPRNLAAGSTTVGREGRGLRPERRLSHGWRMPDNAKSISDKIPLKQRVCWISSA